MNEVTSQTLELWFAALYPQSLEGNRSSPRLEHSIT